MPREAKARTGTSAATGPDRAAGQGRARGFTLLELLLVLAIVALAAGLAAPVLWSGAATRDAERAAWELAAALREVRATAILRNRPAELTIDLARNAYAPSYAEEGTETALPPELQVKLLVAQSQAPSAEVGAIRFYPDGSSSGGRIVLTDRSRQFMVGVEWLTGRVAVAQPQQP